MFNIMLQELLIEIIDFDGKLSELWKKK